MPFVDAQMAKLSARALGEAKREEDDEKAGRRKPKDAAEAKRWAQEAKDEKRGLIIKQQIHDAARYRLMPQYMQAAWIAEHGIPSALEEGGTHPIKGLEPELAAEVYNLSKQDGIPEAFWSAARVDTGKGRLLQRLLKTAREAKP